MIEADFLFEDAFFGGVLLRGSVGISAFVFDQARLRFTHQVALVLKVAANDFFARRMRREPAFAAKEELVDFIFANPIVLVVVEDGQQDV